MKFGFNEQHIEAYAKIGIFLSDNGDKSMVNILNASRHNLSSQLNSLQGREYRGTEDRFYYSGILQLPEKEEKRGPENGRSEYLIRLTAKEQRAIDALAAKHKLMPNDVIQTLIAAAIEQERSQ
jgi:hypothetical protein